MFFDAWYDLLRTAVVGTLTYAGLVIVLRTTGKRTLAKMNAFDLVITVAFGSVFASALLNSQVSLAEGVWAFALLCALQYSVTFLSVRSRRFRDLVKSEPTLLFHRGRYLQTAMRKERVTREEIMSAMRGAGITSPQDVGAVVLETDGSYSVIKANAGAELDSLEYVQRIEDDQ